MIVVSSRPVLSASGLDDFDSLASCSSTGRKVVFLMPSAGSRRSSRNRRRGRCADLDGNHEGYRPCEPGQGWPAQRTLQVFINLRTRPAP